MEFMEFIGPLMSAAAAALRAASSSNTFSLDTNETNWQGRGGKAVWCHLFVGDRFRSTTGRLPQPFSSQGELFVPSASFKDIVSISERTQVYSTTNGTVTERVCDFHYRKIVTENVQLDVFRGHRVMVGENHRYFLDPTNGPHDASEALKYAVNSNSEIELAMHHSLLVRFASFVQQHNDAGGYAVFESTKLSNNWFAIRKIVILGKEVPPRKPVEFHTASISHRLRKGRTYLKEFTNAIVVGAGNSVDMVTGYYSGYRGVKPCICNVVTPSSWMDTAVRNDPGSRFWLVPCHETTYKTIDNGTIQSSVRNVTVNVERPLYGKVFALQERSSKTSCDKIVCTNETVKVSTRGGSVLSTLGAVVHGSRGTNTKYVRADELKSILAALSNLHATGEVLSVSLVDPGLTHSAGKKGTFPVYKLIPVVRIQGRWYKLSTLEPTTYTAPNTTKVRYLGIRNDHNDQVYLQRIAPTIDSM